jgi:hypothetical protein
MASVTAPVAVTHGSSVSMREGERAQHREKVGPAGTGNAEEVAQLSGDDQERRAGREADDDRVRYEVDQRAQLGDPHRQLHRTDQQAQREHQRDVVGAAWNRQRRDRGEHDQRQRVGRAADLLPRRAPQRGDDRRHHRAVEPVLRRQPGQRRIRNTLRQHDQRADEAGHRVGAHRRPVDTGAPGEKGKELDDERGQMRALGSAVSRHNAVRADGRANAS